MSTIPQAPLNDSTRVEPGTGKAVGALALENARSSAKATPAKSDAQKWREHQARQKNYSKKYQDRKAQERKQQGVHRYAVLFPENAFQGETDRSKKKVSNGVQVGGWVCRTQNIADKMEKWLFIYENDGKLLMSFPLKGDDAKKFQLT